MSGWDVVADFWMVDKSSKRESRTLILLGIPLHHERPRWDCVRAMLAL